MEERDCKALFLTSKGDRLGARGLEDRFDLWLRWAGIERADLTVHSLRHTFGSRLYEKTHDLLLVGKAMGHRTLEATKVYVHQDEAAMEEAMETL
jgi:integrase/recombinase XerC